MDLLFLHGGAAAGKLTTARALHARLGWPVFHNHLVVDLLTEVFLFGSPGFVRLREQMWLGVFAEAAAADRSLLFTFAPEASVPRRGEFHKLPEVAQLRSSGTPSGRSSSRPSTSTSTPR